jgi:hypothetical protein
VPDQKRPVDRLLDVFLYAPLGFVMNLEEVIPQLVEKGHQQVTMARMFGKFAVDAGSKEASKRVGPIVEQVVEQAGGIVNRRPSAAPAAAPDARPSPVSVADAGAEPPAPEPELVPDPGSLGITDYDALSASQVVPRLEGLASAELDAVRRYEAANRGRKTILSKIAQLQG